jgi:anti-anti-sigma regulatory factor
MPIFSAQRDQIQATEVDGFLIVNLPPVVTDQVLQKHRELISSLVEQARYRGVIINLEAVGLLDYGSIAQIRSICQANCLLGSKTALMGANPSIAAYLATLSDKFDDLLFCQDVAEAKLTCRAR